MKAGFIGLGNMGGPLARLMADVVDLAVYDPFAAALSAFEGKARLAASAADAVRDAAVVGICVRDDAQARQAVAGPEGVLAGMAAGGIILVHSTILPETVLELGHAAGERGITLLDAPISRTEAFENAPFVFTMTGGDEAAAQTVAPILASYSTDTLHVGSLGSALKLKICNNGVTWVELMLGWQLFRVAEAAGVPPEKLETVMKRNGNLTPSMERMLATRRQFPFGTNPDYDAIMRGQIGIGEKDLQLAIDLGSTQGEDIRMAKEAKALVSRALGGNG